MLTFPSIHVSLAASALALWLASFQLPPALQEPRDPAPEPRPSTPFASRKQKSSGPGGPTQGTERAVLDGLRWFARHQNEDGSWSSTTLKERCDCEDPAYNPKRPYFEKYDTGLTGLAVLCFLGAGFTPDSRQDLVDPAMGRRHKIGDIVRRGLEWLSKRQNPDGSFGSQSYLYNDAIATAALCEAFGATGDGEWRRPARRGLAFLKAAQRPSYTGTGLWGWRYLSRQAIEQYHRGAGSQDAEQLKALYDSDMSCTGWAVMALQSGRAAGLEPKEYGHLQGAMAFTEFVTQSGGDGKPTGLVGYLDPKGAGAKQTGPNDQFLYHPNVMSALGMCIRTFSERNSEDPFLRVAADQILKDLPTITKDKLSIDYYYWYWASLALQQFDGPESPSKTGKHWKPWNKAMVDALLESQDRKERNCTNGGWMNLDRWAFESGPVYTTALAVLTLETYYRYENAFAQRDVSPPKDDAPRLDSKDIVAFQLSREKIRAALKGRDDALAAAMDEAIDLHIEASVAARGSESFGRSQAIEELDEYRPAEVLRAVARCIERAAEAGSPTYSDALRKRVLDPQKGRLVSRWLAEQFVTDQARATAAQLSRDELVQRIASATPANALALAKLGLLGGLRAQVCADPAAWPDVTADLARQSERAADAGEKVDPKREGLQIAKGRIVRTERAVEIAQKRVGAAKDDEHLWTAVRELQGALAELDTFGADLAEFGGARWTAPATPIEAASSQAKGAALSQAALQLGPDRYVERTQLARHLAADPVLALVPVADGLIALVDPREGAADGLVFAVERLGDPYWRIVTTGR